MDDQDEKRPIRRGRRRFLLRVLGALAAFAVVSFLIGLFAAQGGSFFRSAHGEPPGWAEVAGPVLMIVGLLVEVVGIVRGVRSGRYRAGRESRLWAVDWRRRRELTRDVRRGVIGAEEDLPLLRHTARQLVNQQWLVLPFAGLVTMQVGQALLHWSVFWLVVGVLAAAMLALVGWQAVRDARRGEAYLRAHPEPADAADLGSAAPGTSDRSSSTDHWS